MSLAVCTTNKQTVRISKPVLATSRYDLFNYPSEPRTLLYLGYDTLIPTTNTPPPRMYHAGSTLLITASSSCNLSLKQAF